MRDWQGRGEGNRARLLAKPEGEGLAKPPKPSAEFKAVQQANSVMKVTEDDDSPVNLIPAKQRQSSEPLLEF